MHRDGASASVDLELSARPTLHQVVDKISAMLAYWDAEQRCRFANRAYERWFGVTPESLIGKHIQELLGPLYALNLPYIERALRGEPQEFEREIPDPAGGPSRHSLANYIPDVIDGNVRGFFVLVSDISAVKRAELALKESQARFSGIIAVAADAIISTDEEHRITIFNAAAERVFGYASSDVLGRDVAMLLPERLRERHRRHIATFVHEASRSRPMGERTTHIVALRSNGEEFPAEATISKLELGDRYLLTVALRDVTERRRMELEHEVLAEAGAAFSSSLDCEQVLKNIARVAVRHLAELCIVDLVEGDATLHRIAVAHADPALAPACERLEQLALDPRRILASTAIATKQPEIFDDITDDLVVTLAQNDEHLQLFRELSPRSALAVPLVVADRVVGAIVIASTRPHRYTPQDLPLVMELARRAALAIENARLYEAARQATRMRDSVLGIVAHDVRSPLHSIELAAHMLEQQLATSGTVSAEHVARILRAIRRADRLIEDLLDVTTIESGGLSLELAPVSLERVVREVVAAHQPAAAHAALELAVIIEAATVVPQVWADDDRLTQVLENLLGNAIKFTPRGGRVTVAIEQRVDEVIVSVTDTGRGIPEHDLPRVFDRFWQATRSKRQGAGLGLPICKGIIERSGGRIWATSRPGLGSTFCFTLRTCAVPPGTVDRDVVAEGRFELPTKGL